MVSFSNMYRNFFECLTQSEDVVGSLEIGEELPKTACGTV